ncbi:MAG: twin-arginine translocation pathway signal protein [Rhodobacterales bacterium 32-67-9]|nr:MAG: twin-arginine translocation pathway signal protein [Rhodobacterales bacterium 32-67-9]
MGKTVETEKTSRRDFLKLAGTAAPAAAVTALGAAPAEADTAAPGSGLQDTAHIRAYYDSARF